MTTYTRELSPAEQAAVKARWFVTTVENPGFTKQQVLDAAAQTLDALLAIERGDSISVARQGDAEKPAVVKRPGRPKKDG